MNKPKTWITITQGFLSGFFSLFILSYVVDVMTPRPKVLGNSFLHLEWIGLGVSLIIVIVFGFIWRGKTPVFFISYAISSLIAAAAYFCVICLGDMSIAN